jgi:hypothetical protein
LVRLSWLLLVHNLFWLWSLQLLLLLLLLLSVVLVHAVFVRRLLSTLNLDLLLFEQLLLVTEIKLRLLILLDVLQQGGIQLRDFERMVKLLVHTQLILLAQTGVGGGW